MTDIRSIAPTICKLFKVQFPDICSASPVKELSEYCSKNVDRCLLYAPDAVGKNIYLRYKKEFKEVVQQAPIDIELQSMFIPKTPVCFASMFTGAKPNEHGITKYEKPILKKQTVFDKLIDGGKKPLIITVADSSIDMLFRNRNMDYHYEQYDDGVNEKALDMIEENCHDFILVYNQEFDDVMHQNGPYSEEALKALKRHNEAFVKLAEKAAKVWKDYNYLIGYIPDHGCHESSNSGDHGSNIPDDMEVVHFFGCHINGH